MYYLVQAWYISSPRLSRLLAQSCAECLILLLPTRPRTSYFWMFAPPIARRAYQHSTSNLRGAHLAVRGWPTAG